jgi:hypothetical protein
MRGKIVFLVAMSVPVVVLVTIIARRLSLQATSHDSAPLCLFWFSEMKMGQESAGLDALRRLGTSAVPTLQAALRTGEHYQKYRAAWALGQLGPVATNAVPDLVLALDDRDPSVRVCSVQSLAAIGVAQEDAVAKLVAKLHDPILSSQAAKVLEKVECERERQHMPSTSGDKFDYALQFAEAPIPAVRLKALSRIPRDDKRSASLFVALLNDTNGWVREQTARFMVNCGMSAGNIKGSNYPRGF